VINGHGVKEKAMKVCEVCGDEIGGKDGEGMCPRCEEAEERGKRSNARARARRREREAVLRACGLVKVRGALGGVYWE
jgi:rubrerythrin